MGSDMSMNPPTEVKRALIDSDGYMVIQVKMSDEPDTGWRGWWRGPDTPATRDLVTAATGITEFGPKPIRTLRQRLGDAGVNDLSVQTLICEQVSHWLEDHAAAEASKGHRMTLSAAEALAFHAKEALAR